MAQTTQIQAVNFRDSNTNCGNITTAHYTNIYNSDEDGQIMRWLSPLEPDRRHQDVRTDRFDGVGEWLLETSEFRKWRGSEGGEDEAVLFCSGNPGVGKTYLSSLVIDTLCDQRDIVVVGLYCDYHSQHEQTIANMIGAILKQLVGRGNIPDYVRDAFRKAKGTVSSSGLRVPDLMRAWKIAISSLPQVFVCLDALDECLPKHLPEFLGSLRDIVQDCPSTRLFFTGRLHVKEDILRYFTRAVVIPISPNMGDIMNYVEMRLARDSEPEAMNEDLRADIIETISARISDIFLLVSLNMDAILGEITIRQRRKKMEEMSQGKGLSDAYTATLTRLKAQKGNKAGLGLRVLMWVSYSERPLRVEELRHALGVELGSANLDVENVPALRTVIASSLGLVTVEASSSTVRLVHFTLKEHLMSDRTLSPSPHSTIAEVCLTYLNFESVRDVAPTLESAPLAMPLLEYASGYWGMHARRGMTEKAKTLALRLLERFDEHISAQLLLLCSNLNRKDSLYYDGEGGPVGFTGLHGAAFLGIVDIISAVLEMKEWDVNATDGMGITALIWAARNGNERVVNMLLQQEDINADLADTKYGQSPLSLAAENGHEGVVKLLLQKGGVNPDQAETEYGQTPLSLAAENGHEGVVELLLQREGVNLDRADTKYGRTALGWAAQSGYDRVVKILLQQEGVNPDQADTEYGQTPLSLAAENGHEGVVRILLQREGVNPDQADTQYGRTPLSLAAHNGHDGVVKLLLDQEGVNPDQAETEYGQTPLSLAAGDGHEGVVNMLLQQGGVNPDQADTKYGLTPLWWAASDGHEGVVKMLLQREDVNPNQADTDGLTPLSLAASKGRVGVVKMLLQREDVNPNQADTDGLTPLSRAASNGCEGVVKMLLQREDINPNQADTDGLTPLLRAASNGHEGVVKILLQQEGVNPDQADTKYGRTALSWAAQSGYDGIVKILLQQEGVNPDQADTKYGQTALSLAAEYRHEGVVKLLLQHGVNPNPIVTELGGTPLLSAAVGGLDGIVKILLQQEDVRPDQVHAKSGLTPLLCAAASGHQGIVRLLLQQQDVNPNTVDVNGRTALSWAAKRGHLGVVKTLLEWKNVLTTIPNNEGRTPLLLALSEGHEDIVKMLQEHNKINSDPPDPAPQTSLQPATEHADEFVAMKVGTPDPDIADPDGQHTPAPIHLDELEAVSRVNNTVSESPDSGPSSTEPSILTEPPSTLPPQLSSQIAISSHPNSIRSNLSILFDHYFLVASLIFLFAFLLYILSSPYLAIFSFSK